MSRKFTVVLDPGHGGYDSGATGPGGTRECDVNLAVAMLCGALLMGMGVAVVWTRKDDKYVELARRAMIANDAAADCLVSIHCNSGPAGAGEGFEVWTTLGQTCGDRLATCLFRAWRDRFPGMRARMDLSDGDVDKEAGFAVLGRTRCPAALFEMEFLHTARGEAWLRDANNQRRAAESLARGVLNFMGITAKS